MSSKASQHETVQNVTVRNQHPQGEGKGVPKRAGSERRLASLGRVTAAQLGVSGSDCSRRAAAEAWGLRALGLSYLLL